MVESGLAAEAAPARPREWGKILSADTVEDLEPLPPSGEASIGQVRPSEREEEFFDPSPAPSPQASTTPGTMAYELSLGASSVLMISAARHAPVENPPRAAVDPASTSDRCERARRAVAGSAAWCE